jgi:uncharacterized protein with GYD domain
LFDGRAKVCKTLKGKKAFEAAGIKQKAFYMVMGRYDMVTTAEAPELEPVESKQTTWS